MVDDFVSGAKDTLLVEDSACGGSIAGSTDPTEYGSTLCLVNLGNGAGNWKKYNRSSLSVESWRVVQD